MAISEIHTPTPAIPGPLCMVCGCLGELSKKEATALRALLADPSWRYQELSERLEEQGVRLSYQSLARHARGRCMAREKLRGAR